MIVSLLLSCYACIEAEATITGKTLMAVGHKAVGYDG